MHPINIFKTFLFFLPFSAHAYVDSTSASAGGTDFSIPQRSKPGTWSCTDSTVCHSLGDCTEQEFGYRAGYLCRGWPWYNGEYPLLPAASSSSSDRENVCYENVASECTSWTKFKVGETSFSRGYCKCDVFKDQFCQSWTCTELEVTTCASGRIDCGSLIQAAYEVEYYPGCANPNSGYVNDHGTFIPPDCHPKQIKFETMACACKSSHLQTGYNHTSNVCDEWECSKFGSSDTHDVEYLYYKCDDYDSENSYCKTYHYDKDSISVFLNGQCMCSENLYFCRKWTCHQTQWNKHAPNLTYIALGAVFGLPTLYYALGFLCIRFPSLRDNWRVWWDFCRGVILLLLYFVCLYVTVLGGGIGSFLIAASITAGPHVCVGCIALTKTHLCRIPNFLSPRFPFPRKRHVQTAQLHIPTATSIIVDPSDVCDVEVPKLVRRGTSRR